MKIPPALLAALWLAPLPTLHALEPVTLDSLLHEMVDVESIARWPEHEFTCKQASSHDRKKWRPTTQCPGVSVPCVSAKLLNLCIPGRLATLVLRDAPE